MGLHYSCDPWSCDPWSWIVPQGELEAARGQASGLKGAKLP